MLEKKFTIMIPSTPNFIKVGEQNLSIADFSEAELKAIGRAWTDELIKAGKKKRATRPRGLSGVTDKTPPATNDSLHIKCSCESPAPTPSGRCFNCYLLTPNLHATNPHAGDHEDFPALPPLDEETSGIANA